MIDLAGAGSPVVIWGEVMGLWGSALEIALKRFEEAKHPRYPAGDPRARGGQFAPKLRMGYVSVTDPDLKADGTPKSKRAAARYYLKQGLSDADVVKKIQEHFPGTTVQSANFIMTIEKKTLADPNYGKKKKDAPKTYSANDAHTAKQSALDMVKQNYPPSTVASYLQEKFHYPYAAAVTAAYDAYDAFKEAQGVNVDNLDAAVTYAADKAATTSGIVEIQQGIVQEFPELEGEAYGLAYSAVVDNAKSSMLDYAKAAHKNGYAPQTILNAVKEKVSASHPDLVWEDKELELLVNEAVNDSFAPPQAPPAPKQQPAPKEPSASAPSAGGTDASITLPPTSSTGISFAAAQAEAYAHIKNGKSPAKVKQFVVSQYGASETEADAIVASAVYKEKLDKVTYSAELGLKAGHSVKEVAEYTSNKYGVTLDDAQKIAKETNLKIKATSPQSLQAYTAHANEFLSSHPEAILDSNHASIIADLKQTFEYIPDQTAQEIAKVAVGNVYWDKAKTAANAMAAFGVTKDEIENSITQTYTAAGLSQAGLQEIAATAFKNAKPEKVPGVPYDPTDVKLFVAQQVFAGNTAQEIVDATQAQFPALSPVMAHSVMMVVKNNIDGEPTLEAVMGQAKEWAGKGVSLDNMGNMLAAHFPANKNYEINAAVAAAKAAKSPPAKVAPQELTATAQEYLTYGMAQGNVATVLGNLYPLNGKNEHALAIAQASLGKMYVMDAKPKQMARVAADLMEVYPDATYEEVADNMTTLFPSNKSTDLQHAIMTAKLKNAEQKFNLEGLPTETINVAEYGEEPLTVVIGKPKSKREAARFYLQQALPEKLIIQKMIEHFPGTTPASAAFMLKIERDKILGKKYLNKNAKLALGGPMAVPKEIEEQIAKFDAVPDWTGTIDQAALRQWRNTQMKKFLTSQEVNELNAFVAQWSQWPDQPAARLGEHFAGEMWGGKPMSSSTTWDAADFESLKKQYPARAAIMPKLLNFNYAMTQAVLRKIYPDGMVRLFRGVGNKKEYLASAKEKPKQYIYTDALSSWSRSKNVAKGFGGYSTGRLLGLDIPIRDVLITTWEAKMWGDDAEKEFILIGRGLEREADIWDTKNLDLSAVKSAAGAWNANAASAPDDGTLAPLIPNIDADPDDKCWLALMRRYPERYPVDYSQDEIPELGISPMQPVDIPLWQSPLDAIVKRIGAPRVRPPQPRGRI